jgi:hypothetical protein
VTTRLVVDSWVETPDGLGRIVRITTRTRWAFRRPLRELTVEVRLIDGERRFFPPAQLGARP